MQGRHLAPGERHGFPAALRKADRRRLVELIRPKAQRMTQRLIDDVFDALNEQTVTVHSTKVRARARGPLRQLTDPCPYRFCPVVLLPGQAQMEGVRIPVRLPDAVQSRLVADAAPRRIVASAPGWTPRRGWAAACTRPLPARPRACPRGG